MRSLTMVGLFSLCFFFLVGYGSSEQTFWMDKKSFSSNQYLNNQPRLISSDSIFFAAVAQWAQEEFGDASAEASRFCLHVDPRPLRSDIEGAVLREGDLAEGEASVMEHRRAVLQHLDIPQQDALTYHDECLFACDPRLIKQGEVNRVECPQEECMAMVVVASLPIHPDTTANQDTGHSEQAQTAVRVLRLTPFSAYIYELVFQPEGGTYTIVEQKRVSGGAM